MRQFLSLAILLIVFNMSHAQEETQTYRLPAKEIVDLVDSPPTPAISISPKRDLILLLGRSSLPSIEEVSQPQLRLAGLRVNPDTNGISRLGSYFNKLTFKSISTLQEQHVTGLPEGARVNSIRWSPDGKFISFTITEEHGISLWVAETATGKARRLTEPVLNDLFGNSHLWLSDSRTLLCLMIDSQRPLPPSRPSVPKGPIVQESIGKKAPARTNPDLLKSPHDEDLFEYYATSRLARVTLEGQISYLTAATTITDYAPSPDGNYILLETIHRPYSYLVTYNRFPTRFELLDHKGKLLRRLLDRPLVEELPLGFGAVVTGPRGYGWRPDRPATLVWVEAQDGGDPKREASVRDRVWQLDPPFTGEARAIAALEMRFAGIIWSEDGLALISEFEWKTRRQRTWIFRPDATDYSPRKLFDRLTEDRYSSPGNPVLKQTAYGTLVLDCVGTTIYMIGAGASAEGNRPFLDRLDLETGKAERLWRSEAPYYEYPLAINGERVLTSRESVSEPPNYYERDLKTGSLRQLTNFPHPAPQLKDVQKELITYRRKDGVQLTGTLYLPPGYKKEQGPLPVVMWAYPQEFKTTEAASQVSDSPYRFVRIGYNGALFLLTQGYAVLDDPSFPIVGEGEKEPNDSYIEQLVASAEAAIDELVRRGVADRNRIAVGGHSYGAFMTANLLAHSRLFKAGIARSGAYNRTLTPFGFQSEERTLWQAPETYAQMSPFMYADRIKDPLLLIHGEIDNNPGTYPLQTERFYQALKGLGGTVRYVVLPNEAHAYRARESVLHTLWEMTEWLERHLKSKKNSL